METESHLQNVISNLKKNGMMNNVQKVNFCENLNAQMPVA
jgi:hypothetical protein